MVVAHAITDVVDDEAKVGDIGERHRHRCGRVRAGLDW
jgi:hypothetical protein